jgi:glutaredoxin 3
MRARISALIEPVKERKSFDLKRLRVEIGAMKPNKIRLFIKPFCGWCHEAIDWLEERGLEFESLDVTSDRAAREEMFELTGQTLAPVIEIDGEVLADFDTDQLEVFWKKLESSPA